MADQEEIQSVKATENTNENKEDAENKPKEKETVENKPEEKETVENKPEEKETIENKPEDKENVENKDAETKDNKKETESKPEIKKGVENQNKDKKETGSKHEMKKDAKNKNKDKGDTASKHEMKKDTEDKNKIKKETDNKNKNKKDKENKNEKNKEVKPKKEKPYGGAGDVMTDFVEDVWDVMTPELLERLRCVLTEDMGLSKKDADEFIRSQREVRKQRICLKKDKKIIKIGQRNQWIKELARDIANPIALFLVGILLSNRTYRAKMLTDKILQRLCELTGEKTTVKKAKTRTHRILVVVADRLATYLDETLTEMEREKDKAFKPVVSPMDWEKESTVTILSTETSTDSDRKEYDLDQMSESELERLLANEGPFQKPSIQKEKDQGDLSGEVDLASDDEDILSEESEEEKSEDKEGSGEDETAEDESEESVQDEEELGEEEEDNEELSEVEEEEEADEEEKVEEEEVEEEEADEEEVDEEEAEEEEEKEEEIEDDKKDKENEDDKEKSENKEEPGKDTKEIKKPSRTHLDMLDLLKEDIERTPKGKHKTERQMAVKEIIEKRFEELAKDKLEKSLDSIARFDIDETASVVANWLEKILPSGDIKGKLPTLPSLIAKQGSAFEIITDGSEFKVQKVSSTTAAAMVAEAKGIDFPIRKKKLPRSMSPINNKTTVDWADWALEAANVGEEWGKWLDKAVDTVEEHLVKDVKDKDPGSKSENWKSLKDSLGHEAQKWRAEKHKLKGEGILWKKKMDSKPGIPVGPEKVTKTVNY